MVVKTCVHLKLKSARRNVIVDSIHKYLTNLINGNSSVMRHIHFWRRSRTYSDTWIPEGVIGKYYDHLMKIQSIHIFFTIYFLCLSGCDNFHKENSEIIEILHDTSVKIKDVEIRGIQEDWTQEKIQLQISNIVTAGREKFASLKNVLVETNGAAWPAEIGESIRISVIFHEYVYILFNDGSLSLGKVYENGTREMLVGRKWEWPDPPKEDG